MDIGRFYSCTKCLMFTFNIFLWVKTSIDGLLQDYVRKINNPQHDKIAIDRLQKTMNCCFIHHVGSYSPCTLDNLNKSCADQMFIVTSQRHTVIADVAIGCGLVMGLVMIISMLLLCVIREMSTHPYNETSLLNVSQV